MGLFEEYKKQQKQGGLFEAYKNQQSAPKNNLGLLNALSKKQPKVDVPILSVKPSFESRFEDVPKVELPKTVASQPTLPKVLNKNERANSKGKYERMNTPELTQTLQQQAPAPLLGFADSVLMGLPSQSNKELYAQKRQENPIGMGIGQFAGFTAPGMAAYKTVGTAAGKLAAKKISSQLGQEVVKGLASGAVLDTGLGVVAGDTKEELAKRLGRGAALGAVIDVATFGIAKGLRRAFGSGQLQAIPTEQIEEVVKNQPSYSGQYKVKNTQLEQAIARYNEAIEEAQNNFMTNELRVNEMNSVKETLGIDFDKLIKDIEVAENAVSNQTIKNIGETQRLGRAAGVIEPTLPKLNRPRIEPPQLNPNNLRPGQEVNLSQLAREQVGANLAPGRNAGYVTEPTLREVASTADTIPLKPKEKIVSSSKEKTTFNDRLNTFYRRIVDSNMALKNVDDKTFTLATNAKKTGGTVNYIMQEGLVDMNGVKVGKSLKEVIEKIPQDKYDDFWYYYLHKHNIDRAREGKNVFSEFTPEMSEQAYKDLERLHPEFKAIQKDINEFLRTFTTKWSKDAGLIDEELLNSMQETYKNYVPTNRSFSDIENAIPNTQGRGFVNQSSGIKKATGSSRDITDPTENIMELINRTVRTAKYNEVGQSLVNSIRENPEQLKKFAEILPENAEINANVNNVVTVLEKGKKVNVQVNDKDVLDALKKLNDSNLDDVDGLAKKMTNAFKALITQKNPIFALRNIARDIPTAYISGSEKNPLKFFGDLGKSAKDVKTNSPLYQQYKALGGQSSNFFDSNNVSKSVIELTRTNVLKRFSDSVEKFNNVTEVIPRYAEFKRVLESTGDIQKALYASGEVTTNFSRGGDITKKIDAYVPYLNASVQGLDKVVRQFKNKPLGTILKGATIVTAPTLILNHYNKDNPNYEALDNRTKDNYFLIPQEDGTFFKIPKSREYGVLFSVLTERLLRQLEGDENAFKGLGSTISTNFSPANPIENNILSPLVYNIPKNEDFAGRKIIPQGMIMDNRSPRYQYDESTSEIGKAIGDKLNLSPKQVDYLIRSYTGVIGQLLLPATTKYNYNGQTTSKNLLKPITLQFKSDPLYSNQTVTDFYDNYDELKRAAADKNFSEKIPSKVVTNEEKLRNQFAKTSSEFSDIYDQIREYEKQGDTIKVRELRLKLIQLADKANKMLEGGK